MTIQAITRDNGAGLTKDIQVLREAFPDHTVDFAAWNKAPKSGYDLTFHLELINPAHIGSGRNVFVPNAEWFDTSWTRHLGRFDIILAKTRDCESIFGQHHKNVIYTGWTSPDPGCDVVYDNPRLIHIAGKSIMKGTPQVIEAMRRLPDLQMDIVVNRPIKNVPDNITQYIDPTDDKLCELRKAPIHVQPSTYEGFGHVVNEGRAMGAVLITTAAAPMDELVASSYAILCPVSVTRVKALATEQIPDVGALAECIRIATNGVEVHGKLWGDRAKLAYSSQREAFHQKIRTL